jgi:hypothetical protein
MKKNKLRYELEHSKHGLCVYVNGKVDAFYFFNN